MTDGIQALSSLDTYVVYIYQRAHGVKKYVQSINCYKTSVCLKNYFGYLAKQCIFLLKYKKRDKIENRKKPFNVNEYLNVKVYRI